ncbi:MAG TPA: 50S ribosomal protein L11 methyltransferase [Stellaceae bacterium]|nr:50S ribosomal protein L11 methyltransferase [Stellaceae bacterium]
MSSDAAAFVRAETAIDAPSLVPEIKLHLASAVTPLWHATEATLEAKQLPPPYWAFAWPGGQALARHLLDRPALVAGKSVLDFGAGSGLVAIAARKAGAAKSVAAEIDAFAVAAIALNAALNDAAVVVESGDIIGDDRGWDVVLIGDMCYERPLAERLVPWLRALAARGATVLLGDPGRAYLPKDGLTQIAEYAVPTSLDLEDRTIRATAIWRLA